MRRLNLSLIVCVLILLTPVLIISENNPSEKIIYFQNKIEIPKIRLQLIEHAPISILNDSDFISYGFPGTGNSTDPYVIENLNISNYVEDGILVSSVSKHFFIINCLISNVETGIHIYNTTANTVKLINNTCENNAKGIYISESEHCLIANNTCINNYHNGIHLRYSDNSNIVNNTCRENYVGIGIDENSQYCSVVNSSLIDNQYGIEFEADNTFISNNNISLNYGGIYTYSNQNSVILSNTLMFNDYAITIYFSQYFSIKNNHFVNNNYGCIYLDDSTNGIIQNNLFVNTSDLSIYLGSAAYYITIFNNTFQNNNAEGIQAWDSGASNYWYSEDEKLGNSWSDWIGYDYYRLIGPANSVDKYPMVLDSHVDNDNDSMPDNWEILVGLNPSVDDSDSDADDDGLSNYIEYTIRTNPNIQDTDDDGITDGYEVNIYFTDPLDEDTDDDGLSDGEEIYPYNTDPLNPDSDNDGFTDGEEVIAGTDPRDPNSYPGYEAPLLGGDFNFPIYAGAIIMCLAFLGLLGLGYFVVFKQRII